MKVPPLAAVARPMFPPPIGVRVPAVKVRSPAALSTPAGSALALIAPLDSTCSEAPAVTVSRLRSRGLTVWAVRAGAWPGVIVSAPVDRMISPPWPVLALVAVSVPVASTTAPVMPEALSAAR